MVFRVGKTVRPACVLMFLFSLFSRYHISHLFKGLWESALHRQAFVNESKSGKQFVKFVNFFLNDTTYLLDECLEYLKRIHETQVLMMDDSGWNALTQEAQQSRHPC